MDGYDLGVVDVSSDPMKALVLEQRHQAAIEICNVVGFPCQMLGLKDSTYQNAKEAKKLLWANIIIPELQEFRDGLNKWLAPQFGDVYIDFKIDHIDALEEDKLMRGKSVKEFAGTCTINEARIMLGFKPFSWMSEPTSMEEFKEQMYLGFTQAVVSDQEEISNQNGSNEEQDSDGSNSKDK